MAATTMPPRRRPGKASWAGPLLTVAVLAIVTLLGFTQVKQEIRGSTGWVLLAFLPLLTLLWGALAVEIRSRPYSLHLLHLIGLYIFLAAAPLYQCASGFFPLPQFARVEADIVYKTNAVVLLWTLAYLIAYAATNLLYRKPGAIGRVMDREVPTSRIDFVYYLIIPCLVYLMALGLGGVVTRAGTFEALVGDAETSTWVSIHIRLVRAFPFVALGAALLSLRARPRMFPLLLLPLVFGGILYADNPLASARFYLVAVIFGLVAPHLLRPRRTGTLTLACMSVGLVILPGFGRARHAETAGEVAEALSGFVSPVSYLTLSGDVLGYGMTTLVWRYLELFGVTLGGQIQSALLFFVPRSIWPGKSIGTGQLISQSLDFDFTNRAAPIIAEPLIDFGWIGVPIFAVLFGVMLARLDRLYFSGSRDRVRVIDTFYPFIVGLMLFVTRGDLLTAMSAVFSFLGPALPFALWLGRRKLTAADSANGVRGRVTAPT